MQGDRIKIVRDSQLLAFQWVLHQKTLAGRCNAMLIVNLLYFDAAALSR